MLQPHITALIDFLNALLEVDRHAVAELVSVDVVCTDALANHPTVQVRAGGFTTYQPVGQNRVTMLGILNGFCGVYEDTPENQELGIVNWGPIMAVYNNGQLERFIETKHAKEQEDMLVKSAPPLVKELDDQHPLSTETLDED